MKPPKYQGHSADVQMHLYVGGRVLPIAQLGPGFITLRNPIDLPPVEAEISLSIDGNVERWRVQLPEGISTQKQETKTEPCPSNSSGSAVA